jgi:long-chain acyl-CoA synthetase
MERVELLTLLERRAATTVTPEVRATIFTVRQLIDAVKAGARSGAAAGEAPTEPAWATILAQPADPALVAQFRRSRGEAFQLVLFALVLRAAFLVVRLFVRVRVTGRDRVPASGAGLLCPNHQTFLDGFFLAATLPIATQQRMFFVGAAELFETPASRWFARLINLVPIDPDAHLVEAIRAGAAGLAQGRLLLIFPEAERSIDGELKRFRKGAAILAAYRDAPIVPVALVGFFPLWPRGRPLQWRALWPPRAREIGIAFGEPMRVAPGDETAATTRLRDAVEKLMRLEAKL